MREWVLGMTPIPLPTDEDQAGSSNSDGVPAAPVQVKPRSVLKNELVAKADARSSVRKKGDAPFARKGTQFAKMAGRRASTAWNARGK